MKKKRDIQTYFNQKQKLTLKNPTYRRQVKFLTDWFINEDKGTTGDLTSQALIPKNKQTTATIIAKQNGIIAGLEEVQWLATCCMLHVACYVKDSRPVREGQKIMEISGSTRKILLLERTILNVLQRMSGIATQTHALIKRTNGKALLCSTRKTQWGLLDKKAVTVGGGGTHRLGLHDFILIKENHLSQISDFRFQISDFWEIEVENQKEALQWAEKKPGAMMFDDFTPTQIKKTIAKLPKNIIFEASGGINEKNIADYANTGVDIISMGALTHSVKALDIGMYIQ